LPAGAVRCNIKFAYQAADANHPEGQSKLAAEYGNFVEQLIPWLFEYGKGSHRNDITRVRRLAEPSRSRQPDWPDLGAFVCAAAKGIFAAVLKAVPDFLYTGATGFERHFP
jgi:hypothetical protein